MLEEQLKRIADALEKQNALTESLIGNKNQLPSLTSTVANGPKVEKKAPKAAPVVEKEPEPDVNSMFDESAPAGITQESLKETMTQHAHLFGAKTTIALMVVHGADKTTPKISTIPQANWQAAFDQATAEIKKFKK